MCRTPYYHTTVFDHAKNGSWTKVAEALQKATYREHFSEVEVAGPEEDDTDEDGSAAESDGAEAEEEDTESDTESEDGEMVLEDDDENEAIVNSKEGSESILMCAVKGGSLLVVQQLIAHGADIHCSDDEGKSAVTLAAKHERIEITKLLLSNGASINHADKDGMTPLMAACLVGSQVMMELLISNGADVNIVNVDGNTALMIAVSLSFHAIAQTLLDGGADSTVANKAGRTAWDMAKTHELKTVLEAGTALPGSSWLAQRLKAWSVPAHVIRHCVRVLVEQAGFYAERTLLSLPSHAFAHEYLQSLGITALGTQQILMNVHTGLQEGSVATPKSPTRAARGRRSASAATATAAATWLSKKLSGYDIPADRITHCEKVLVHLQGFTSAAVLASLPAERFTCAYLQSVGIMGLGLQQVLISVKATLHSETHGGAGKSEVAAVLPSVYDAVPGARGVKRARKDTTEGEEEDE